VRRVARVPRSGVRVLDRAVARPTRRLIRRIGEDFALEDAAAVLDQLREVPECLPLGELQDPERTQASLVLPAAGDLGTFLSQLELAREDWRDALVVAGLGGSDWPAKLNEAPGRPRISPRLWTYPFHAQSWDEIQDEYTALASRDTSLAPWAAIANSVGASPAKGQLAGRITTHVHDLEVTTAPVGEPPVEVVVVRSPHSLHDRSPKGKVVIEHLSTTGRDDKSERSVEDAVPLFWRFILEKFGVSGRG
jgi:hypothetical protein